MAGERDVDPNAATHASPEQGADGPSSGKAGRASPEAETKTEAGRKVVKLASFDLPCERLAHFALEYSVYEVLLNPERGSAFATIATEAGPDLIPASLDLAGARAPRPGAH